MSARRIWGVNERDFPAHGSPRKKLEFALIYVALAPTENNWQPWYFRLADKHVELMVKNNPEREEEDPDRREFMIGCGSALLYLKHALKHFGCLGQVELFPDLGQPALVARVHFGSCRKGDTQDELLFEAMPHGRTNVSPLGETPVSETMLAVLANAAAGERGWLDFVQSETSRQQVLEVTLAENRRWTDLDRLPVPPANVTVGMLSSRWLRPLFAFGDRDVDFLNEAVEPVGQPEIPAATLAVVKTKTDDKHGWLAAGQTMARTVLQAQALGLSWAFFNPVRRRQAREELRLGVGHKGFAQVILRFGPLMTDDIFQSAVPATDALVYR